MWKLTGAKCFVPGIVLPGLCLELIGRANFLVGQFQCFLGHGGQISSFLAVLGREICRGVVEADVSARVSACFKGHIFERLTWNIPKNIKKVFFSNGVEVSPLVLSLSKSPNNHEL